MLNETNTKKEVKRQYIKVDYDYKKMIETIGRGSTKKGLDTLIVSYKNTTKNPQENKILNLFTKIKKIKL